MTSSSPLNLDALAALVATELAWSPRSSPAPARAEVLAVVAEHAAVAMRWSAIAAPGSHPIENQISADRWVVEFFLRGPQGEFVVLENVITRVQPGCQPQLGCELGCAGLPGCQQGCEGLQGQIGPRDCSITRPTS